jgi:hypothetical protein
MDWDNFNFKREEAKGEWGKLHCEGFDDFVLLTK